MGETKFTPGPWDVCREGDCHCKIVWARPADHPVAQVIAGEWGDDYPTIELEGGSLERTAKAVMAQITYGSVSEESAKANAHLIAAAPELYEALAALSTLYESIYVRMSSAEMDAVEKAWAKADAALSKARGEQ